MSASHLVRDPAAGDCSGPGRGKEEQLSERRTASPLGKGKMENR